MTATPRKHRKHFPGTLSSDVNSLKGTTGTTGTTHDVLAASKDGAANTNRTKRQVSQPSP